MTKPRQILLDHIGRGTTFYLTPQEKERLLECIKVVDSHKEAVQSNYKCHQSDSVVEEWEKEFDSFFEVWTATDKNEKRVGSWNPPDVFTMKQFIQSHLTTLQQTAQQEKGELVSEIKEFLLGGCGKKDCARGQCLTVRVRREAWKEIKAIAQARGISVSDK